MFSSIPFFYRALTDLVRRLQLPLKNGMIFKEWLMVPYHQKTSLPTQVSIKVLSVSYCQLVDNAQGVASLCPRVINDSEIWRD